MGIRVTQRFSKLIEERIHFDRFALVKALRAAAKESRMSGLACDERNGWELEIDEDAVTIVLVLTRKEEEKGDDDRP